MRFLIFLAGCSGSGLGKGGAGGTISECSLESGSGADADGDGVCDLDDDCDDGDDNVDGDDDGQADDCDPCPEDIFDDSDLDGVCDTDDVCPGFPDADLDGDGIKEACGGHTLTASMHNLADPTKVTWKIVVADDDIDLVDDGETLGQGGFASTDQVLTKDVVVPVTRWICIELLNSAGNGGVSGYITDNDRQEVDEFGVEADAVLIDFFDGSWSEDYFKCAEVTE